jgi:hypothetical protein
MLYTLHKKRPITFCSLSGIDNIRAYECTKAGFFFKNDYYAENPPAQWMFSLHGRGMLFL